VVYFGSSGTAGWLTARLEETWPRSRSGSRTARLGWSLDSRIASSPNTSLPCPSQATIAGERRLSRFAGKRIVCSCKQYLLSMPRRRGLDHVPADLGPHSRTQRTPSGSECQRRCRVQSHDLEEPCARHLRLNWEGMQTRRVMLASVKTRHRLHDDVATVSYVLRIACGGA
jgi:hypothetical protein